MTPPVPSDDREQELTALLEISRVLASNVNLRGLVQAILEQLKTVIDYTGASVVTLEPGGIEIVESTGPGGREEEAISSHIPIAETSAIMRNARAGETMLIDDVTVGTGLAKSFQEAFAAHVPRPNFVYIRSWMCVPLKLEDRVVGLLSLSSATPGYFNQHHVDLAQLVARQAAVAAENARLFEQTQAQARESTALLEVTRAISSTLELQPLLELILDRLKEMVPYDGAAVMLGEDGVMRQLAMRRPSTPGISDAPDESPRETRAENFSVMWERIRVGDYVIIDDVWDDTVEGREYRNQWGGDLRGTRVEYVHSFLNVSLIIRGEMIGVLSLGHSTPGFFNEEHARVARAFADQAAVAIENARLFEKTERRERELAAVLEVSRTIASSLDRREVLGAILDQLGAIMKHTGASVLLFRDDALEFVEARSITGVRAQAGARIPFEVAPNLLKAAREGQAVILDDVNGDDPLAVDLRASMESVGLLGRPPFDVIRSWMAVPLAIKDHVFGLLTISWTEPSYFTEDHARVARLFADQAALAIENARLFQQSEQRTRELSALLDVSGAVVSTLNLRELMGVVLDELKKIIEHTGSAFVMLEGDALVVRDSRAIAGAEEEIGARVPLGVAGGIWSQVQQGAFIIDDIRSDDQSAVALREALAPLGGLSVPPFSLIRSWMAVPIVARGETIGMLTMSTDTPSSFTVEDARLARAFADQAAIAIENANLFAQTGRLAAVEERQRLARELHDSVSQALYGIALGARTARTHMDRDASKAIEPLDYVLSLADAGLAEMRALIFELRPESLESEGLVVALEKQIVATGARYGIVVAADLGAEPDVSIEVKECLYRIGQEALHNVVKHANATEASVTLRTENGRVELIVQDNGRGFDPGADFAGHLGLRSMRERCAALHGDVTIESAEGEGTTIRAAIDRPA